MANKIQVKRGLQASLPTLDVGEPALTTNSGAEKVYIGTGTGNKEIPTLVGGVLPVVKGGTGQSTLALARNAMGLGNTTGAVPILNGGTGSTTASGAKSAIGLGSVMNYGLATLAEAQAGTSDIKYMTPLRVKDAITALGTKVAVGSYSGNSYAGTSQIDASLRSIEVGFQPKFVYIVGNTDLILATYINGKGKALGMANYINVETSTMPGVYATGFYIKNSSTRDECSTNLNGQTYNWVAIL